MKVSRGVETSVKVGVEQKAVDSCRCRASVEEETPKVRTESRSIELAVEVLSRGQKVCRLIHQVSRSYRDCNKKKLKKLDR